MKLVIIKYPCKTMRMHKLRVRYISKPPININIYMKRMILLRDLKFCWIQI